MSSTKKSALDFINEIVAKYIQPVRQARFRYYRLKGDPYAFCWSTEKTTYKGGEKPGFYAFVYRINKDGTWRVKRAVRFGKRHKAKSRAYQWYEKRRVKIGGNP